MQREIDPKLQKLYDSNAKVYSISRCNIIDNCLYEAYCTYILKQKGAPGIYGELGSQIHDLLQGIIDGDAKPEWLIDAMNHELSTLEYLGIEFPKGKNGEDSIRNNWVANMTHFCNTFKRPAGYFQTEQLVLYPLGNNRWVQGYIDLIQLHGNKEISIFDWKTSSDFAKADLLHHGRQLAFYALAKELEGYKVRRVAWIMLKYVQVEYIGKKTVTSKKLSNITKVCERRNIYNTLKPALTDNLINAGYEVGIATQLVESNNNLKLLPKEALANIHIKPYVREYSLSDEIKEECISYINGCADKFESLDPEDTKSWPPRSFTKINSRGIETPDIFYCTALCDHRQTCTHIAQYLADREAKENSSSFDDLF